jgi:hypothetical protein
MAHPGPLGWLINTSPLLVPTRPTAQGPSKKHLDLEGNLETLLKKEVLFFNRGERQGEGIKASDAVSRWS